jgi:DNA-binding NtrC family response regulator
MNAIRSRDSQPPIRAVTHPRSGRFVAGCAEEHNTPPVLMTFLFLMVTLNLMSQFPVGKMNVDVLVASSDAENRSVLVDILGQSGAKSLIAGNVDEVQTILAERSIDLVFCDERLPGGGFHYVLLLTKTIGGGVPLVLSSFLGELDHYLEAIELGVVDFIAPPFGTADVNSVIGSIRQNRPSRLTEGTRPPYGRKPPERMISVAYDC